MDKKSLFRALIVAMAVAGLGVAACGGGAPKAPDAPTGGAAPSAMPDPAAATNSATPAATPPP